MRLLKENWGRWQSQGLRGLTWKFHPRRGRASLQPLQKTNLMDNQCLIVPGRVRTDILFDHGGILEIYHFCGKATETEVGVGMEERLKSLCLYLGPLQYKCLWQVAVSHLCSRTKWWRDVGWQLIAPSVKGRTIMFWQRKHQSIDTVVIILAQRDYSVQTKWTMCRRRSKRSHPTPETESTWFKPFWVKRTIFRNTSSHHGT